MVTVLNLKGLSWHLLSYSQAYTVRPYRCRFPSPLPHHPIHIIQPPLRLCD